MEETLKVMTEQLAALSVTSRGSPHTKRCFKCGKLGHIASNCCSRNDITCFNCGKRGHSYQNCWSQGNGRWGVQNPELGTLPRIEQCLTYCTHLHTCKQQWHSLCTRAVKHQAFHNFAKFRSVVFSSQQGSHVTTKYQAHQPNQIGECRWQEHHTLWHNHSNCHLGIIFSRAHFHCCWPPIPAILGCDFLREHGFILNFESGTFYRAGFPKQVLYCHYIYQHQNHATQLPLMRTVLRPFQLSVMGTTFNLRCPLMFTPCWDQIQECKELFSNQLGQTNVNEHVIDTGEAAPIKVSPHQIPFHYADRVHSQFQDMAKEGIIWPSTSPWCAPAIYVPKSSTGEVRICVDFVKLNQVTKKDSYPVPRPEGPQQRIAGKKVFSKLDLRSAYWQFPMED